MDDDIELKQPLNENNEEEYKKIKRKELILKNLKYLRHFFYFLTIFFVLTSFIFHVNQGGKLPKIGCHRIHHFNNKEKTEKYINKILDDEYKNDINNKEKYDSKLMNVLDSLLENNDDDDTSHNEKICPSYPIILSEDNEKSWKYLKSKKYSEIALKRLQGAIRIPTESFDDTGEPGEDERLEVFYDFEEYLKKTYPRVFKHLDFEKANTHGLLFTWKGSNETLKPYIFMAHQDVVPAPRSTYDRWTHPPFDAFFDGERVWGRGSVDAKNNLIGILSAVDFLLENEYKPQRTILLSFGYDEEISGTRGAKHLAELIISKYGKDSIYAIIDEGDGLKHEFGSYFAAVPTSEKGFFNIRLTVNAKGGHSSVPPPENGIGMLASAIKKIDHDPFPVELDEANPVFNFLQCVGAYAKEDEINPILRKSLRHMDESWAAKLIVKKIISNYIPLAKYLLSTTQATTLVGGGQKVNALPEQSWVVVNHRIAINSLSKDVLARFVERLKNLAQKYEIGLVANDEEIIPPTDKGYFNVETYGEPLEFAPVSPTNGDSFKILAGTTRNIFENYYGINETVHVAPAIMTGNTDTRYYWDLTPNIYRFAPVVDMYGSNIHTVDENIKLKDHIMTIAFYKELMQNVNRFIDY